MNKILAILLFLFLTISSAHSLEYNYESTVKIPVKLTVKNDILSEKEVYEGQTIEFKTARNVVHNGYVIAKRGTPASAKVKVIITSGMNGIPASIIFGDFRIDGLQSSKLSESYEVFGQDRSLIVFPLKWALTWLPPTGSLTNFIKGGHAKLRKDKIIVIYYYPEWL